MEHSKTFNKIAVFLLIGFFLFSYISASDLEDYKNDKKGKWCIHLDRGDIVRCETKGKARDYREVDLEREKLLVKEDGLYVDEEKIKSKDRSSVYIHKNYKNEKGKVYHVDNLNYNEVDVYLEFEYDKQPSWIEHYNKDGELVKTYYKGEEEWSWTYDCQEVDCMDTSGKVVLYVEDISERSIGSDIFPSGLVSPYDGWVVAGDYYASFDGVNDYVRSSFNSTINGTVSLWFKFSSDYSGTTNRTLISTDTADSKNTLRFNQTGSLVWENVGGEILYSSRTSWDTNWQHVLLTSNDTGMDMYINGTLVRTASTGDESFLPITNGLYLAYDKNEDGYYFNGSLDDFRIYNQSFTASDVASLYANYTVGTNGLIVSSNIKSDNLRLLINFDDAITVDASNNNVNNTMFGGTYRTISLDEISLVEDTDYTIDTDTGLLNITNSLYDYYRIDIDYTYQGFIAGGNLSRTLINLILGITALLIIAILVGSLINSLEE